jgi:hypothetical protein
MAATMTLLGTTCATGGRPDGAPKHRVASLEALYSPEECVEEVLRSSP